jgi:hypothetical protein
MAITISMGEIILGSLAFLAIVTGFVSVFGTYYENMGIANPFGSTAYNATQVNASVTYLDNWANQTAVSLSNAQAIPFFGGSFMLLTGVFQSLTLLVEAPARVVLPIVAMTVSALHLPMWFLGFLFASVVILCMIALIHAMGGGGA